MRRVAQTFTMISLLTAPAAAHADSHSPVHWPGGFVSRVELLALIETLNADLLAARSATATLEKWCADHKLAPEPKIIARPIEGAAKAPGEETLRRLGVAGPEAVKYRHVELACGAHVLSRADNWYVPARLPEETNRLLETTQTPFGKAIAPLQPWRRTVDAKILWSPLPAGWEMKTAPDAAREDAGGIDVAPDIIEHRAIVFSNDNKPVSEVVETYAGEALDFAPRQD